MNSQVCGCPILGLDRRRFRGLIGVLSRTDSSVVALAGAAASKAANAAMGYFFHRVTSCEKRSDGDREYAAAPSHLGTPDGPRYI